VFGTQSISRLFGFAYSKSFCTSNFNGTIAHSTPGFTKGKFAANHALGWDVTSELQKSQLSQSTDPLPEKHIAVAFQNVHFRYPTRERNVLKGISFEVESIPTHKL